MQLRQAVQKLALTSCLISGCASSSKSVPQPIFSGKKYEQAFNQVKSFIQTCLPKANLRANLYTDIPEGELVMDHLPAATVFVTGAAVTSSYEGAKEDLKVHFIGSDKGTRIESSNELGRQMVLAAMAGSACPQLK